MRNTFAASLAFFGMSFSCLTLISSGQQPLQEKPVKLTVLANEVLLSVTVRDKRGALATSLNVNDFTLTEDGRPQKIQSFTRESTLPFRVGLLVDTSRSLSGMLNGERKAAGKFVETMLPADPEAGRNEMFLIHFDREVELLEDFTTSRDKIERELDTLGPTRREQNDAQGPETAGDDRSGRGRGGTQLYDAIFLASDELMKTKDGRKVLVVFSNGVDRGSKENLNDAIDAADRAGLSVYTIYFRGEEGRASGDFPGMGGHRGGGYPGGGGGYPGGSPGGGKHGGKDEIAVDGKKIMEKIAVRTGGRYFEAKKKENLDEIYGLIADELRGQYLLTYTPDQVDKEGGFHKVVVKANKNDLTVVTREGYYAPEPSK